MVIDAKGGLLFIFLNLLIMIIPFVLIEMILLYTVKIECKENQNA
jgi:hypothetical protein